MKIKGHGLTCKFLYLLVHRLLLVDLQPVSTVKHLNLVLSAVLHLQQILHLGHLLPLICLSHHPLHSRLLAIEFFSDPFLKLPESLQSIFFQLVTPLGFILLKLFFDYLLGLLKLLRKEGVIPSHVLSVKGEALVETPWTNPVLFDLLVNDL